MGQDFPGGVRPGILRLVEGNPEILQEGPEEFRAAFPPWGAPVRGQGDLVAEVQGAGREVGPGPPREFDHGPLAPPEAAVLQGVVEPAVGLFEERPPTPHHAPRGLAEGLGENPGLPGSDLQERDVLVVLPVLLVGGGPTDTGRAGVQVDHDRPALLQRLLPAVAPPDRFGVEPAAGGLHFREHPERGILVAGFPVGPDRADVVGLLLQIRVALEPAVGAPALLLREEQGDVVVAVTPVPAPFGGVRLPVVFEEPLPEPVEEDGLVEAFPGIEEDQGPLEEGLVQPAPVFRVVGFLRSLLPGHGL